MRLEVFAGMFELGIKFCPFRPHFLRTLNSLELHPNIAFQKLFTLLPRIHSPNHKDYMMVKIAERFSEVPIL